ncbi:MAG: hypothetical protein KAS74_02200 [Methanosarcinales archaeon]|nr:hypothetical protein [Methanosarcinales archaeon]
MFLIVTPFLAIANAQTVTLGEAVDNTDLTWTTGGDADWFGQTSVYYYDGNAAQSGDIAGGQSSWIQTTVTGPGILSFYWKVSSIWASSDLEFYMDGVEKSKCWADEEWELEASSVPSGSHTLRWEYAPFIHQEGDAGFLDKVVFSSEPVIIVKSPNGGETWYHRTFHTIQWLSHECAGSNVKIGLYKGGNLSYTISASTDNDGYYSWLVPVMLEPRTDYQIKVTPISNSSVFDYSDSYFSITEWYQSSFGGLLVLDGDDDYAETQDHSELDVGDEAGESFTIEAWVYIRGSSSSFSDPQYIVNKPDSYNLYALRYYDWSRHDYVGCVGYRLTLPSGQLKGIEHCMWPAYSLGWHHVALVFYQETGEARIYLDGEACGDSYSVGSAINNSTEGVKIGVNLDGAVDEVRISDVARYTDTTYTKPTSPFTCDEHTRALWHFDEFEGATVFHDVCGTADNVLVGYNGAHTEGVTTVTPATPEDAAIALRMAVRGEYTTAADVSGDNRVTSLDALMILQAAAGAIGL